MRPSCCLLLFIGLIFSRPHTLRADVLDGWTTNQITTNGAALKHIVYGNGRYVAVGERGDEGDIYSSEDGINWTLRYTDQNAWGLTLAFSGGQFVGVGGWETAVSVNGTNWMVSFLPSTAGPQTDLTYGNDRYVMVGDTNGVGTILNEFDNLFS